MHRGRTTAARRPCRPRAAEAPRSTASIRKRVDSLARPPGFRGPVHGTQRPEVGRINRDVELLERLPARGLQHGLTRLDVPGRSASPVLVHVPGATAQLEEHLRTNARPAAKYDVRGGDHPETVDHVKSPNMPRTTV